MLQNTKQAVILPLKSEPLWTESVINLLDLYGDPNDRSSPRGYKLKPLTANLIVGAFERSPTISSSVELYDLAHGLSKKFGPKLIMAIYYGVINGNREDLMSLNATPSAETIEINGAHLHVAYVIYALLVSVAITDCISLVSNRMGITQAKRWLRRLTTSLSSKALSHYVNEIRPLLRNDTTSRPYDFPNNTKVHYVSGQYFSKLQEKCQHRGVDSSLTSRVVNEAISKKRRASDEIMRNSQYYQGQRPQRH